MSLDDLPRMDHAEFRDLGFLQEVNRLVLHPCGLALAVEPDGTLSVLDDHADPEGFVFVLGNASDDDKRRFRDNVGRVRNAMGIHTTARQDLFGAASPIQSPDDAVVRMP